MSAETIEQFNEHVRKSFAERTFVKLTLGNYKGNEEQLQKVLVREIDTQKGPQIQMLYRYATRDIAKNFHSDEALKMIAKELNSDFRSGNLFTTENDYQLIVGKRSSRIITGKPTFHSKTNTAHDREKHYSVDPSAFYLKALGITTADGEVRSKQRDKWKQINKFVEIIGDLVENSELKDTKKLHVVDMGSGKGYLTFAVFEHFRKYLGEKSDLSVTGIEARKDIVDLCNDVAKNGDYDGLKFIVGNIADQEISEADIVIALHACDTATDDALFKGIMAEAKIIVAAPCCHKQIRPQITSPHLLKGVLKHGTLLERTAETLTDGLRALLLENSGYSTKVFEFVPTEHTPKNNMIAAVRSDRTAKDAAEQIAAIKEAFGISNHRLETLLSE